jgi:transcriptional regulator with XRE-family HTH domain
MDQLKRLRREMGLSQAKLAALADVDPSTVNQIERGAREASPATLRKLADALDVSIAALLEDTSPKGRAPSSQEKLFNNGIVEEERRARWEAAVENARRLREGGHARLEELVTAWQASRERGELRSARRRYKEEIEQLFNKAHGAAHGLADFLFVEGGIPAEEDWEEVRAADRFYWTLIEMMRNAGFVIQEHNSEPPTVEEREAV